VAKDARLLAGFLKRGMHPGGGHFVILSRLIGREAAAAMALFGEEINGDKAVELGLAWEPLDDDAGEDRAIELATRVASDPNLRGWRSATSAGGRQRRGRLGRRDAVRAPRPDVVHAPLGSVAGQPPTQLAVHRDGGVQRAEDADQLGGHPLQQQVAGGDR
jgi:enoyl-CoA hydratase/carnithine racemase